MNIASMSRSNSDREVQGRQTMRYKLLGKSGLRVSELCLGAMTFGGTFGLIDNHRR
jgi:hypothetical protein